MSSSWPRLLTVREVCESLGGVSRDTFYRWRQLGTAPPGFRLPNGELRFREDELVEWIETLRTDAA
jgi:excisionase family DNA binding protein